MTDPLAARPGRNPRDVSTWGPECGRGIRYADTGAAVASGTKGQVHKISTGRKARGMASDDWTRYSLLGAMLNSPEFRERRLRKFLTR